MRRYPGESNTKPPAYWWLIRLLYNLAFPVVLLLLLPGYLRRMIKRGSFRKDFGQRFGRYSPEMKATLEEGHWIWVHAVSVGEVLIALKLIRSMKEEHPNLKVVLSTTTSTGRQLAADAKLDWVQLIYNPIDFIPFIRTALEEIQPRAIILVEAEVWPNLVSEAQFRGIPVALVNARLSPRSQKRYRLARALVAPLFNQLDLICVQEPEDVEKWESFGVRPEKIYCIGSIKFDDQGESTGELRPDFTKLLADLGVKPGAPVIVGGSTHAGEELILAEITRRLRERFPDLFLILVPRHVERTEEIRTELTHAGFRVAQRSKANAESKPEMLLVDTTGELRDWYRFASVVFVGKSLTAKGGQNPLEPVSVGKPVLFGPNLQNFEIIHRQLLSSSATIPIENPAGLEQALATLLENPEKQKELATRAAAILDRHRGATNRTRALLALH